MFLQPPVTIESPLGPLALGVVDPHAAGVAEAVALLLFRSTQDAREETGGHLPTWLVRDIERSYISPEKIRTLWAENGHRFVLCLGGEIVGTVHVAKQHGMILAVDRNRNNVPASEHPGFKPEGLHDVLNLSVKHELRRLRLATRMLDGIVTHFRALFDGEGLWVRADPPWHAELVGLGFVHEPAFDVFLPADVVRTADLPHADFNRRFACDCPGAPAWRAEAMLEKKLQYVAFSRRFDRVAGDTAVAPPALEIDLPTREAFAEDWSHDARIVPAAIAEPATTDEIAALLAWATRERRRVAVRGAGYSAAGQASGTDILLSLRKRRRILTLDETSVTVAAGMTWSLLLPALTRLPPVIPALGEATIGGTLATGGFAKGSREHGFVIDHVLELVVITGDGRRITCNPQHASWLFDAVLGGYGQFGIIAEAKLALEPVSPRSVQTTKIACATIDDVERELLVEAYHATGYRTEAGWVVARTVVADEGQRFAEFILPKPLVAKGRQYITQVLVADLAGIEGDVQIHLVRPPRRGLLFPRIPGLVGDRMFVVTAIATSPLVLPGTPTFLGGLPSIWPDAYHRVKELADPRDVLE